MKEITRGLCQVVTPGIIFSLVIYTDMPEGNDTKTEQRFSDSPAQGTSPGPCSEPLLWLPAQVRLGPGY